MTRITNCTLFDIKNPVVALYCPSFIITTENIKRIISQIHTPAFLLQDDEMYVIQLLTNVFTLCTSIKGRKVTSTLQTSTMVYVQYVQMEDAVSIC